MRRLTVSGQARADIRHIIDYLKQHAGRRTALRYALDFDAAFDRIAEQSGIGSPRPVLGSGGRMVVVDPYLIFYDVEANDDVMCFA